jgi:hypothetical protein
MIKNRKVYVRLSNGFGNNLFQLSAAKLLGAYHGCDVVAVPPFKDYYGIPFFKKMNIKITNNLETNKHCAVDDSNFIAAFNKEHTKNFILRGQFEDYRYYLKNKDLLNSWFLKCEKRNNNDLVIHFRGTDRLVHKNEFNFKPKIESYIRAVEQFKFDNLHIVSDMPRWDYITKEDLENMSFHIKVSKEKRVPVEKSVEYFNSIVKGLEKYKPIFIKRSISDDFNFIRGSKNILFEHGTMSWWAAFLSEAEKVGVYGPWRAWKGKKNKNLSQIPLKTWFRWE